MNAIVETVIGVVFFCFSTLAFGGTFAYLVNGIMSWPISADAATIGIVLSLVFGVASTAVLVHRAE
jgi:hypothetical protein